MPTAARAEAMAAALRRRGAADRGRAAPVGAGRRRVSTSSSGPGRRRGRRARASRSRVVIDEHDETLQEERSPTWHARDVLVERARRAGVPVLATSPCPSVTGRGGDRRRAGAAPGRAPSGPGGRSSTSSTGRDEEPWKTSLLSSPLIRELRRPGREGRLRPQHAGPRSRPGVPDVPGAGPLRTVRRRGRACPTSRRCAAPGAAPSGRRCASSAAHRAFANLRPGVTRLREELEAAAGRPVVAVTGADDEPPADAGVYVGTEAVLHRVDRADVVAFLDFDRELLAPRYRADEQAMALLTQGGPAPRPARARRAAADPDVPAAPRGDPGRAARRPAPAARARAVTPASCSACRRRWRSPTCRAPAAAP